MAWVVPLFESGMGMRLSSIGSKRRAEQSAWLLNWALTHLKNAVEQVPDLMRGRLGLWGC